MGAANTNIRLIWCLQRESESCSDDCIWKVKVFSSDDCRTKVNFIDNQLPAVQTDRQKVKLGLMPVDRK